MSNLQILFTGFTIFAMFFGAGNVIFPLALGQYAKDQTLFAMLGMSVTAVLIPLAGFIAMILYRGDYGSFFGRIGKIPGYFLAFFIITLLGPVGSAPRCVAVAFSTFKGVFPSLSLFFFSAIFCIFIFLSSIRKGFILTLLGRVLTPMLLISLLAIICIGFFAPSDSTPSMIPKTHLFLHGLQEGYHTMDLLAAFFFSSTIVSRLRKSQHSMSSVIKASVIGAFLLCAIYFGMSMVSALHSSSLSIQGKEELLGALVMKISGPIGSILVCVTITLACFTTAIALMSAFTEFVQKEVFKEKVNRMTILAAALILMFFISMYEFTGISAFLTPILTFCYPGLILLTLVNIFLKIREAQKAKRHEMH